MDVRPVRWYRNPGYPARMEVLARPELLERHTPPAWRKRTEMAGAVALLLAANGCTNRESGGSGVSGKAAVVAPIFEHGAGVGTTGCVVVAPPVFLSEEEALQVITAQLAEAGIQVTGAHQRLPGVHVLHGPTEVGKTREARPLEADGIVDNAQVAFEFVSAADYFNFGGIRSGSTVQSYNLKSVAQSLTHDVADRGKGGYFGTFYDPAQKIDGSLDSALGPPGADWRQKAAAAKEESKRLLREQVKDFVDWLQGQGAI